MPTYAIDRGYEWNYDHGPRFTGGLPELFAGPSVSFLGRELNSTLGIPAGPLLNSKWIVLYASLGFDILTYKTVRSRFRPCHPAPNVVLLDAPEQIWPNPRARLVIRPDGDDAPGGVSITNSFGTPSQDPHVWMADMALARAAIGPGQMLVASVVGTSAPGQTLEELAEDFAMCARGCVEAGAHAVEANFSCPNLQGVEGNLFQDARASAVISRCMKQAIGAIPLILKIGAVDRREALEAFVGAVGGDVDGMAAINTVPAIVVDRDGRQALPGEGRLTSGVCGAAIREAARQTVAWLLDIREREGARYRVIAVGGANTASEIADRYRLGADGVQSATGAMWDPYLAATYRGSLVPT
ncbi:MAG: beta/alpha barrel domain-containing protein [Chloroflexota bacterium]